MQPIIKSDGKHDETVFLFGVIILMGLIFAVFYFGSLLLDNYSGHKPNPAAETAVTLK